MARSEHGELAILKQLDRAGSSDGMWSFPDLGHVYLHPVISRMSVYASDCAWAIIIETVTVNDRSLGHRGITDTLWCYGSCLREPIGAPDQNRICRTGDGPEGPTFTDNAGGEGNLVRKEARTIRVRGVLLELPDSSAYSNAGVILSNPPNIEVFELIRVLATRHPELFLASAQELKSRMSQDIPLLMTLNEWNHPSIGHGDRPSQNETFQMIARAIVTQDVLSYRPAACANTHWSNWPEAGTW